MSHVTSFIRIPALAIRQRIRPLTRIGVLDEDVLRQRVWPQDIDFNLHLNNARYLTFMDYGRVHLMAVIGILTPALRQRWQPLVGSVSITYRRSLGLFEPFTLSTRLLCWDEKWLYMQQVFQAEAGLIATAWVKGLFRGSRGTIPSQQVIDLASPGFVSPPVSASFDQWNALIKESLSETPATGE